jgi:deazaflavin-dependent oxidoreductase (nitroreductase family)
VTLHRALTGVHTRYINKVAARLAGRRGSLADLEHVGRTSGVVRHTPLRAFRTGDTVVIGLNFGRESDWLKNIAAAGGCRMRLGGEILELGAPRVVPIQEGAPGMPRWFGLGLRYLVRTTDCVQLPVLASGQPRMPQPNRSDPRSTRLDAGPTPWNAPTRRAQPRQRPTS